MMMTKKQTKIVSYEPQRYKAKQTSLPVYKKAKIKMLERDFCIPMNAEEKGYLNALTTETEIDRYAHKLMDKYWN
jgi:hypothetical protein